MIAIFLPDLHKSSPISISSNSSKKKKNLRRDYDTKWNKSEKDKYHIIPLYVESKKWYTWYLQNRNRLTDINPPYDHQRGNGGGGIN